MTAKKQRANDYHEDEPRQDEGRGDGESKGEETARNSDAAPSQANAAAADETAQAGEAEAGGAEAKTAEAKELDRLRTEVAELKDRLQRAMAETENVRRRADRERQEALKYATSPLAKDIIGVADNLRRALDSVGADARTADETLKTLLAGVEMTEKDLAETLAKHGIRKVDAKPGDRFDPHRHEAMFEMPDDRHAPGSIVQVVQNGYLLHDRLLRPARVGVARAGEGGGVAKGNGSGGNVDTKA